MLLCDQGKSAASLVTSARHLSLPLCQLPQSAASDRFLNVQIGALLFIQLGLAFGLGGASVAWQSAHARSGWYLQFEKRVAGSYSSDVVALFIRVLTFWCVACSAGALFCCILLLN